MARIIIRMNNRGEDSFKHEMYGDTITVERYLCLYSWKNNNLLTLHISRQLSKDGRNAYLLKNSQGKIVSKKRADLQELMEHFYIHIDNPCEILMQDTSRQFLVKDSPKDKYHVRVKWVNSIPSFWFANVWYLSQFFLTGTVLYQLEQELAKIKELLPLFSSVIASKVSEWIVDDDEKSNCNNVCVFYRKKESLTRSVEWKSSRMSFVWFSTWKDWKNKLKDWRRYAK